MLDKVLKENNISWNKVLCFSADNAAVMTGSISGTAAFIRKAIPNAYIMGCLCHRLHLAAEKGAKQLTFSPEDLLIPIYYYLEKSSKRHKEFKQIQIMCSVETHTILKHICTRWLSMERALGRLLEQWVPLQVSFKGEAELGTKKRKGSESCGPSQAKRLKVTKSSAKNPSRSLTSNTTSSSIKKSSISATHSSAKTTSRSLTSNTSSSSMKKSSTSVTHSSAKTTSRSLTSNTASSSMKKSSTSATHTCSSAKTTCSNKSNKEAVQTISKAGEIYAKLNNKYKMYCIFLLDTISMFNRLNVELQEEAPKIHLVHEKLQNFLRDVMVRFVKPCVLASAISLEQCEYKVVDNQKLDDELILGQSVREFLASGQLSSIEVAEFFTSVRNYYVTVCNYVIQTFPLKDEVLLNACVADPSRRLSTKFSSVAYFVKRFHYMEDKMDALEEEFGQFQVDPLESLVLDQRVDTVWMEISGIKDKTTGKEKYLYLSKIMVMILSLAHSNAEDERLFSLVRKNATDFRPNLSTQTLSDFLTQKMYSHAKKVVCHKMTLDDQLLVKCKQAARTYNRQ